MHVGPKIINPQLLGPGLFLRWFVLEEEDVGFDPLCIENAGWQTKQRVNVALLQQILSDGFSGPALEQNVIRDDDRTAAIDLQHRLDILQEVQLLVLGRDSKSLTLVGRVIGFEVTILLVNMSA